MSKRWRSNPLGIALELSALLTVVAGLAVLLKIAGAARGNLDFAFALVRASDFGHILLSTMLGMVPALSIAVVLVVETFAVPRIYSAIVERRRIRYSRLAWPAAAVASAFVVSTVFQTRSDRIVLVVASAAYAIALAGFLIVKPRLSRWAAARRGSTKTRRDKLETFGLVFITLGLFGFFVGVGANALSELVPTDEIWAPKEALYFEDREPYIGRVLSADEDWIHVVIDDPREINIVPAGQLAGRVICTPHSSVDDIEESLWTANVSQRVSLDIRQCEEVLSEFMEAFARDATE